MNGMSQGLAGAVHGISVWALPLLLAITLHEAAHGFAAFALGDDTAKRMGRVSANPIRHIDPFGTIVLPAMLLLQGGFMFGWAKPVPVDFGRLKPRRMGMVLVALAGPATNLAQAVVAAALIHLALLAPPWIRDWAGENLFNAIRINLVLAVFNMLPLPPLDGGRVAVGLLPNVLARPLASLERWGMLIILVAFVALPYAGVNVFGWVVGLPASILRVWVFRLTGLA